MTAKMSAKGAFKKPRAGVLRHLLSDGLLYEEIKAIEAGLSKL
jgi:hypothetical protein